MRYLSCLLCACLFAACGAAPAPTATPAPAAPISVVGELTTAPPAGLANVIGVLLIDVTGARLVERLQLTDDGLIPFGAHIWLDAPALPPEPALAERGDARYGIAQARGVVQGPGAYGPGGASAFQIVDARLTILSPRELTIPLLLGNTDLYEGQFVRLNGQILASPSSTLLVEQLGPGGVPSAGALQVKVRPIPTAELDAGFSGAPGGSVRFGPAELLGIWRGGLLIPLAIAPAP